MSAAISHRDLATPIVLPPANDGPLPLMMRLAKTPAISTALMGGQTYNGATSTNGGKDSTNDYSNDDQ